MTAELDLSLIPPLGEPRPHPVPEAHETTLPNGLHVVVVPRPGVPLVELRLRVPFAAPNARSPRRAHRARRACCPAPCCSAPTRTTRPASPSCCRATAPSCRCPPTPTGCCSAPRCCPDGLARCSACSPSCSPARPTPPTGSRASATGSPSGSGSPAPSPGSSPARALAARRYGDHPYAVQLPDPELVVAVDGAGAAPAAPRAGAARRQHPGARRRPRPAAATDAVAEALAGWVGDGQGGRDAAGARAARRRARAGRPARRGAVQPAPRRPRAAAAPIPTCPPSGWPT